jgi:hypothetical protein
MSTVPVTAPVAEAETVPVYLPRQLQQLVESYTPEQKRQPEVSLYILDTGS